MNSLVSVNKLIRNALAVFLSAGILSGAALVGATGTLVVSPSTGLTNGQIVKVSGSNFAHSSIGSILECNSDPTQPTIMVAGNAVPVSCSNPLLTLVTTTKTGDLPSTAFTVHSGTVGPPTTGTDSSGGGASSDAAKYPCPPTAAQIAAGDNCQITFGDQSGDDVAQNIAFASQTPNPTPTPTPNSSSTTGGGSNNSNSNSSHSNLVNTGPGDVLAIFGVTVISATLLRYIYWTRRAKT